jgi:hypothetical protein
MLRTMYCPRAITAVSVLAATSGYGGSNLRFCRDDT